MASHQCNRKATIETLLVCGALERAGCHVVAAQAITHPPKVVAVAVRGKLFNYRHIYANPADLNGVKIEWRNHP